MHDGGGSAFLGLIIIGMIIAAYFIPSFVASGRGHQNTAAIVVMNIFLGWTFWGWVAALVWAFTEVRPKAATRP
ncbi:superinfection immunity protein [Bradyrhizobium sp. Pear77]|uniref:superinfection immunity protein n=1 Tax=Bradyrhizobium altum TaxID=1571202 RepID=UPI00289CFB0A|nr:superinfection immunity protein [Bradyrhizobium altum]MCC8953229.1 superinfection immunity protein [Bradyrhizobium altum]